MDFGELRSVLQGGDTQQTWEALCELIMPLSELDQRTLEYIEGHLRRWPAKHRPAPQAWLSQLIEGGHSPQALQVARAVSLCFVTMSEQQLGLLARSPLLGQLQELSLWAISPKAQRLDLGCFTDASWESLESLVIGASGLEPQGLKAFLSAPWLERLTSLGLPGVGLEVLARYAWTPRLERLDLSSNPIGARLAFSLGQGFERLVELDVSRAGILGAQLRGCFDGLGVLRALRLSQNPLGLDGVRALLEALPKQLELLDLHQCELGADGLGALLGGLAKRASSLKILDVSGNRLEDDQLDGLTQGFSALERLELGGCGIGAQAARCLGDAQVFKGVRSVGLSHNVLGQEGAQALAKVPSVFEGVRSLSLGYNELDGRAMRVMSKAGCFDSLEALHLQDNPLGLDGIKALCARWPKQLKTLVLTRCHLRSEAIALLASAKGVGSLDELVLHGNMLDDKALYALSKSEALSPALRSRWAV